MAFSIEQIEEITKYIYGFDDASFEQNKIIIIDYLSGKSNDLSQLAHCARNDQFYKLFTFFYLSEDWTPNDDRVCDILWHPIIATSTHPHYLNINSLIEFNTQKAFDKVLIILRKFSLSDKEIMFRLICTVYVQENSPYLKTDSPYCSFVINQLKNCTVSDIDYLTNAKHQQTYSFQYSIYYWLQLNHPEKAYTYATLGFKNSDSSQCFKTSNCLLSMNYLKHIELIDTLINTYIPVTNIRTAQTWYYLQLIKSKYNPNVIEKEILEQATCYLQKFTETAYTDSYEQSFDLDSPFIGNYRYYQLSTIALYHIFLDNKHTGLEWIRKILHFPQAINPQHLELLHRFNPDEALPLLLIALSRSTTDSSYKGSYYRYILELIETYPFGSYKEELYKFEKYTSKTVRNLIVQHIIRQDSNPIEKALVLLNHKKADVRLMAVQLLQSVGTEEAIEAIRHSLNEEKNDDTRDVMMYSLEEEEHTKNDEQLLFQLIEATRNRGKLIDPVIAWTEEVGLPPIYFTSGRTATQEETRFLFYRMSRSKEIRSDLEARSMLRLIDKEKSDAFAQKLFKAYADKGCDVKQKSLMTIAALIGGDDLVDQLRSAINLWIDGGRKAMAEYGILALAIQGSNKALRWVEWYSRKYKSKKTFVGETALLALDAAAAELNISRNELGDRIVPDFGFEGLFKNFEINGDEYRAFIDNKFKIAFFNEDNKKLKSLPSAASAELKETFKDIAKELRDVVKSQSMRLEHYLVSQRVWDAEAWSGFFLDNPIMFTYATRLLWEVSRADGTALRFICQEDTTLLNKAEEEIRFEYGDTVVMAHPYFIDATELDGWRRWYFDQEMEEIFPQLDRKLYTLDEIKKQSKIYTDLEDSKTESGAIRSTLEKRGWGKCGDTESGFIEYLYKEDIEAGVRAMLEVFGVSVAGYDYDNEPSIGRLYFLSLNYKNKPMWLMAPKNETDERLVALGAIPPVLYSEILSDLHAIKLKELVG
jgi:hypothetical protein